MKGMTGYGRAKLDNGLYQVVTEICAVNKRHLDIAIHLPMLYQHVEASIRSELSKTIFRGQINVKVRVSCLNVTQEIASIHMPTLEVQLALLRHIEKHLACKVSSEVVALELWRAQMNAEVMGIESDPEVEALILRSVQEAFLYFDARRQSEGSFVANGLREQLLGLRKIKEQISSKIIQQSDLVRQRLLSLVGKHTPSLASDDRILREIVLYIDKIDITEEVARIGHHLDHIDAVLNQSGALGKLLEFLLQELLREFNTLGAKTILSEVSTAVVLAKTEVEKMREQIQNVE